MAPVLDQWLQAAHTIGVFQYVLPFLLTFTILYGLLEKTTPLGAEHSDRLNVIVAGAVALFVLGAVPRGSSLGLFFSNFFGALAVVLVGVFAAMLVLTLVFRRSPESVWTRSLAALAVVAVGAVFLAWGGIGMLFPATDGPAIPSYALTELAGFAALAGTVYFIIWLFSGGDRSGQEPRQQSAET